MHLHWRQRELVKLITKQKTLAFVEEMASLLEYKSGGILVAIDRLPKGFSLIYYRGKDYKRPITLRYRNLLTKTKQHSISMQRHEGEESDGNGGGFDDTEDSDWDDENSKLQTQNDGFPLEGRLKYLHNNA